MGKSRKNAVPQVGLWKLCVMMVTLQLLMAPRNSHGFMASSITTTKITSYCENPQRGSVASSYYSMMMMMMKDDNDNNRHEIMMEGGKEVIIPSSNDNDNDGNGWMQWFEQGCRKANGKMMSCAVGGMMMAMAMVGGVEVSEAIDYKTMPLENRAVAEAWRIVDNNYIDRTFNKQDWFGMRQSLVSKAKYNTMDDASAAIDKMVATLGDKYTRYLPPAKYTSIVNAATGTLAGGIGVELSSDAKTNMVYVSDIQPNSPAEEAGIAAGDVFLQVDGLQVDDGRTTPDDVAARLRGPENSRVGLTIQRPTSKEDFILTRRPITVASIKSYISPSNKNIGVIKIKVFSGTTSDKVKEALLALKKQGATSIVLDLRNNVGGLLPGGVETASLFLDKDLPVVFVVDKKGVVDSQSTYQEGLDITDPMVLVVNENTASAAEVLTAALLENNRVVVVGTQTFGKGIVQTIRQLNFDNGGVAVTVARYETPLHHDINKQGIPVNMPLSNNADNACEAKNKNDIVACIPSNAFQPPPVK